MIIPIRLHKRAELLSKLRGVPASSGAGAPLEWFIDARLTQELSALRADVPDTISKLVAMSTETVKAALNTQAKTLSLTPIDAEGVSSPIQVLLKANH